MDGLPDYYCAIVEECIENNLTKDETERYVQEVHQIPLQHTNRVWDHLERTNPDLFIAYNARMRERNARIPKRVAKPSSPPEVTSARRRKVRGTKKEYRLSPYCRPLLTAINVPDASPQEASSYPNALENQNLQASQQQPAYLNDFWQQLLSTLGQIQSNTDQMLKLLTDGHGFGPHLSAARSSKRQRVGEAEERGKNEEAEKLQKKEEGDDNEAEKPQENERAGDEEAETRQENERGDNEEAEKLQEKEEGNDGEAEKLQDYICHKKRMEKFSH
ncbi:BnaA02g24760D [Brassica napus]|uniref:BnaA02g24760D protein n=1 Tax=Brassica napus TaxID=3708 RepID=A0A078HH10_BRANA|nr:BnaA02g24760D [Brassica napus]